MRILARLAIVVAALVAAVPVSAQTMNATRRGASSSASCSPSTASMARGVGRIYGDGSVIGTMQHRGSGPTARCGCRPARSRSRARPCAALKGMPFEPCFTLTRTSEHCSAARSRASASPIATSPAAARWRAQARARFPHDPCRSRHRRSPPTTERTARRLGRVLTRPNIAHHGGFEVLGLAPKARSRASSTRYGARPAARRDVRQPFPRSPRGACRSRPR